MSHSLTDRLGRWLLLLLVGLATLLSGCQSGVPVAGAPLPTTAAATASQPTEPSPAAVSSPTDAPPPTAEPSPTSRPPTEVPPTQTTGMVAARDLALETDDVVLYPVPSIYAGDKVTFQVFPAIPADLNIHEVVVDIKINGEYVAGGPLQRRNWNGQAEAVFEWAWDTTNLAGDHELRVRLDPDAALVAWDADPTNNEIVSTVSVLAAAQLPKNEATAEWITTETNCCIIHVVSGTAAERDLGSLSNSLEIAVAEASRQLGEQPSRKLNVYFIDRVLGQGGFAGSDMVVSYVDRQYAGGGLNELLVHEAIHVIDRQFAPKRIAFLAEGVAVWASGGHYKPEDLNLRSAALVEMGQYVPLAELINDFYPVQHEIGYLQAGGLVTYLVNQRGWSTFRQFYSNVDSDDGPTLAAAVDANLQAYYGLSLEQLEAEWLAYLRTLPQDPAVAADLATTLRYYDVMRHYQQSHDPTAYFLNAWLPHPTAVREQGNPADLSRNPTTELNITLELMLHEADKALRQGDYNRAGVLTDSVSRVLDTGNFFDPLSAEFLNIVRAAAVYDYELHDLTIQGNTALAIATQAPDVRLKTLNMERRGREWVILSH